MKISLGELADRIGAGLEGEAGAEACGVCAPADAAPGFVVYVERARDLPLLEGRGAAAIICAPGLEAGGANRLVRERPKLAFIEALKVFYTPAAPAAGVHPSAVVHSGARVHEGASVGACAVVEDGAEIGDGAAVMACAYVGEGAVIGARCVLHAGAAVMRGCVLGEGVVLHGGVVIGADGFGYERDGATHLKVPQVGTVVIEDGVEIGANSAVDRATLGETRIGAGTKIDNLVQVGHNCRIGRGVIICGQCGISGSCEIGDMAVLAGQVGVADHVKIGAGAIIGGQAGVVSDVPAGKFYSGMPAAPHRETMRQLSALKRLPELEREVAQLKKELEELGNMAGGAGQSG